MTNHKCEKCGGPLRTRRENVPWDALPHATLLGVEVQRCVACGNFGIVFPSMDGLIGEATRVLLDKPGRLVGAEIRFLRSLLGFDSVDLAPLLGANPSTLSRWEHDKQPIGWPSDLLLRAFVRGQRGEPVLPAKLPTDMETPWKLGFEVRNGRWTGKIMGGVVPRGPAKVKIVPRPPVSTEHKISRARRA